MDGMYKFIEQHKKILLPISVLLLAFFLFFLMITLGQKKNNGGPVEKSWNVATVKAVRGSHTPNLILYGITESPQKATLESTIRADVAKLNVFEGNLVKKAQVLIELDDRETKLLVRQRQAEVANLKATLKTEFNRFATDKASLVHEETLLALARKDFERQQTLLNKRVGSQSALDNTAKDLRRQELTVTTRKNAIADHVHRLAQLKARLESAQAMLEQAELDLSRTKIRAPFNGRVTKLDVAVGNRVQVGEPLIRLYDSDNVEVRAQIPTQYLTAIHDAMDKHITLEARATMDGKLYQLYLARLAGEVERGRGGVDAMFKLSNQHNHISLGRSVEMILDLPTLDNVFKIPFTAIYGSNRIYIVQQGRMKGLQVRRRGLMQSFHGPTFVLIDGSGLKPGDLIITTQLPNARTGLKVTVSPS